MAQEPRTPWSRWDQPMEENVGPAGPLPAPPRAPLGFPSPQFEGHPGFAIPSNSPILPGTPVVDAFLVTKEPNPDDPNFFHCIYGIPNNVQQIVQECHVDVDCCERTCCDTNWQLKYTWAIILLVLIGLVVLIGLSVWLIVWLINRSRDKAQRKQMIEETPYGSRINIMQPQGGINPNGTLQRY